MCITAVSLDFFTGKAVKSQPMHRQHNIITPRIVDRFAKTCEVRKQEVHGLIFRLDHLLSPCTNKVLLVMLTIGKDSRE